MTARLAVCLAAALLACAQGSSARRERMPEASAALATPEPDPACRGTVQQRLLVEGIDQITVELAVDPKGAVTVDRVLAPDLTPAEAEDLRAALGRCIWTPAETGRSAHATLVLTAPREPPP